MVLRDILGCFNHKLWNYHMIFKLLFLELKSNGEHQLVMDNLFKNIGHAFI